MNFTQKLLEYINGLDEKEAAKRFNRTIQAVRIWKATGNVPLVIVQQIMDETNGLEATNSVGTPVLSPEYADMINTPKDEMEGDVVSSPRTGLINEDAVPVSPQVNPDGVPVDSASYAQTNDNPIVDGMLQRLDKLEAFARMMTDPDRLQSSDVRPASPQVQVPIVSGVSQVTTEIPAQPVYTANAPSTFIEQHVEAAENPNGVGVGWNKPYPRDNRR